MAQRALAHQHIQSGVAMSTLRSPLIHGPEVEGSRPRAAAAFHRLNYKDAPGAAKPPRYLPVELQGRTMRNELRLLASHRRSVGLPVGHEWSCLEVAADIAAAIFGADATARNIEGVCTRIGLPPQKAATYEHLIARASHARRSAGPDDLRLLDPEVIGNKIGLSAEERDNLEIRRIGSFDETPHERKKRRDRDRKAAARARVGATPQSQSAASEEPWKKLGVSRSTYYAKGINRGRTGSSGLSC